MTGSNEFSMLNIDKHSRLEHQKWINQNSYLEYTLNMGPQIKIEKRIVTSLPSLFGEIGGLYDFLILIVLFIISGF